MLRSLLKGAKFVKVKDPTADGTSDVTSDAVNMAGYRGVVFFSSYGTAASGNKPHAEQSDDNAVADSFADLANTEVGVGASDEDVALEIYEPREQYVRTVWARGTSSTLGDIWAILFDPVQTPVDNNASGTFKGESHISPAEGTK